MPRFYSAFASRIITQKNDFGDSRPIGEFRTVTRCKLFGHTVYNRTGSRGVTRDGVNLPGCRLTRGATRDAHLRCSHPSEPYSSLSGENNEYTYSLPPWCLLVPVGRFGGTPNHYTRATVVVGRSAKALMTSGWLGVPPKIPTMPPSPRAKHTPALFSGVEYLLPQTVGCNNFSCASSGGDCIKKALGCNNLGLQANIISSGSEEAY